MSDIRNVKLELLRPGPAHNQLLSPLTPYLALCGADGPVTVNMPFEQRQILTRLQRLRYSIGSSEVVAQQREAEVRELGEALGAVLGQVPALLSELGRARSDAANLVHLRLSLSAFELGLVPFELAIGPDGFPGSGSPLFLQSNAPITLTREVRRGRPLSFDWNRPPCLLFAFASPGGLAPVPAQDHLKALRRAIEPWVKWALRPEERVQEVRRMLTVLPEATLEDIREACASRRYTHVHILAHGAPFEQAGDRQYGVALASETTSGAYDVVDGERLAIALTQRDPHGAARHRPTLVTLATCDSGNINTLLTPGGSIAHALHAADIPWVIASQFPLWMRASSIAAEVLYSGLLRGDDPRWVLYELRQRLRTDSPETHDWASIVAYATVPWDFARQVNAFRDKQTRAKLEVKFDRADRLVAQEVPDEEFEALCRSIREDHAAWRAELGSRAARSERSERLGMSAAFEKRIGVLYSQAKREDLSRRAYQAARDFYRQAIDCEPSNHWAITQYLSILATPALNGAAAPSHLATQYGEWWSAARQIARWQLGTASGADQAWPLGTLAELALLGAVYAGNGFDAARAEAELTGYCRQLREVSAGNSFPVASTRRQFKRYVDFWPRAEWAPLAAAALAALGDEAAA
jgi:hypothetical protein